MPTLLTDLRIDRVDLVDEGADSAAFIELYKRKEIVMKLEEILAKMKPEHAQVITDAIAAAQTDVTKANEKIAELNVEKGTLTAQVAAADAKVVERDAEISKLKLAQPAEPTEEDFVKSLPAETRAMFEKMKVQKDAAEESLRKAKEAEATATAVAKAATLKALPVEATKLAEIVKNCDNDMYEVLSTINAAIEGTVLTEVGKSTSTSTIAKDAWGKIEAKAAELATSENISKQKAIGEVVKRHPDLYEAYLNGGAN